MTSPELLRNAADRVIRRLKLVAYATEAAVSAVEDADAAIERRDPNADRAVQVAESSLKLALELMKDTREGNRR